MKTTNGVNKKIYELSCVFVPGIVYFIFELLKLLSNKWKQLQNKWNTFCMDTEYIFLRIILGLDLLLSQLNPLVMSCSLSWLSSSLSLMIIVDHLGEVCWVGRLVRTGIDSQGVFGGSWLGLPGLQCTITPPHHHHQYHQCHTTTSDVVWCWCLGGPPPHHITPPPPPPPTSLHQQ